MRRWVSLLEANPSGPTMNLTQTCQQALATQIFHMLELLSIVRPLTLVTDAGVVEGFLASGTA